MNILLLDGVKAIESYLYVTNTERDMFGKRGLGMEMLGRIIIVLAAAFAVIAVIIMLAKGNITGGIGEKLLGLFQ